MNDPSSRNLGRSSNSTFIVHDDAEQSLPSPQVALSSHNRNDDHHQPSRNVRSTQGRRLINPTDVGENEISEELDLKYGAQHVISIFTPVTVCMCVVVAVISSITFYTRDDGYQLIYTPFREDANDSVDSIWKAFVNAGILLIFVAFMTFVLIFAYKYKCYRLIHGWLFLSSLMLLSIFTLLFISTLLQTYNLPLDYFTLAFLIWNFGVVGMISIHWKAPLFMQQCYLVFVSALMALVFIKYLPNWTTWTVLGAVALWDLFAVLAPCGPLRMLVETAQSRNEQVFTALVYSAGSGMVLMASESNTRNKTSNKTDEKTQQITLNEHELMNSSSSERDIPNTKRKSSSKLEKKNDGTEDTRKQNVGLDGAEEIEANLEEANPPPNEISSDALNDRNEERDDSDDDKGIKLGLGDFIFYSILVGKASSYGDWNTNVACFVSILIGLCLTLVLLAVFKKALPALPFSIAFGLLFYFATRQIISPFSDALAMKQIFI